MAKILFDLMATQSAGSSKYHGGGEYAKTVFFEIINSKKVEDIVEIFYDRKRDLDPEIKSICEKSRILCHDFVSEENLSKLMENNKYDVFYTAMPYVYFKVSIPPETRFIYTVHGLRGMELPFDKVSYEYSRSVFNRKAKKIRDFFLPRNKFKDFYNQKNNINHLLDVTPNQKILTASYHSKYSLLTFFPNISENNITVCYSPEKVVQTLSTNENDVLCKYNVEKNKYILIISANRWEKNAVRGVCAIDNLISKSNMFREHKLKTLVLGVTDKNMYERLIVNKEGFNLVSYVETEELEVLYKNAYTFLYPSMNEGFGYPPVEAMKYGTVCACSAIAAITEVCGDAVLYFNPFDINEIENRILQTLDNDIREAIKEKELKRVAEIHCMQSKSLKKIADTIFMRG